MNFKKLSRTISIIENEGQGYDDILKSLKPGTEGKIIGVTGPPGAGKSTMINGIIRMLTAEGKSVAVLAVDPSSPFNMGALLGDRLRMSDHFLRQDVFIRSLASRGALGGLCEKAMEIVDVLKAYGFDFIFVETVGVGQSEIDIAGLADATLLVMVPGSGDEVQFIKAGIIEIADVIAVNKSDREGGDLTVKNLIQTLSQKQNRLWMPPVIKSVAVEDKGLGEIISAIKKYLSVQGKGNVFNEKKIWALTEKAYRLIRKKRMNDVDRKKLQALIEGKCQATGFNLYRFAENYPEC